MPIIFMAYTHSAHAHCKKPIGGDVCETVECWVAILAQWMRAEPDGGT